MRLDPLLDVFDRVLNAPDTVLTDLGGVPLSATFPDDFGGDAGVREFLARYRPDLRFQLANTGCRLDPIEYDWSLNSPPEE